MGETDFSLVSTDIETLIVTPKGYVWKFPRGTEAAHKAFQNLVRQFWGEIGVKDERYVQLNVRLNECKKHRYFAMITFYAKSVNITTWAPRFEGNEYDDEAVDPRIFSEESWLLAIKEMLRNYDQRVLDYAKRVK